MYSTDGCHGFQTFHILDEPLRPSVSAFGFDIGSTQKELFVEGESSYDGEWKDENEHNEEDIK